MLADFKYFIAISIHKYLLFSALLQFVYKKRSRTGTIEKEKPLIACGSHFNCFTDGNVFLGCSQRRTSALVSSGSFRQKFAGFMMRLAGSIPINRPMDLSYPGQGTVTIKNGLAEGFDTQFQKDFKPNFSLALGLTEVRVLEILSDQCLKVDSEIEVLERKTFRVNPKADNKACFSTSIDILKSGGSILLFPEGETHEEPKMIELKAGVALIIIDTFNCGVIPTIQCFSYVLPNPTKYRSFLQLVVGKPFQIPEEIMRLNREQAIKGILAVIKEVISIKEV